MTNISQLFSSTVELREFNTKNINHIPSFGSSLCELLKSLRLGVSVQQIEEISIEENWFSSI
jgi:hypothetical protein